MQTNFTEPSNRYGLHPFPHLLAARSPPDNSVLNKFNFKKKLRLNVISLMYSLRTRAVDLAGREDHWESGSLSLLHWRLRGFQSSDVKASLSQLPPPPAFPRQSLSIVARPLTRFQFCDILAKFSFAHSVHSESNAVHHQCRLVQWIRRTWHNAPLICSYDPMNKMCCTSSPMGKT